MTSEPINTGNKWLRKILDRLRTLEVSPVVRNLILILGDGLALTIAYFGSHYLQMTAGEWIRAFFSLALYYPIYLIGGYVVLAMMRIYRTLSRYVSIDAVYYITAISLLAVAIPAVFHRVLMSNAFAWTNHCIQWMILAALIGGMRLTVRWIRQIPDSSGGNRRRVIIYGAGDAGEMLARDIIHSPVYGLQLVGFIDDALFKKQKIIHGRTVLGGRDSAAAIVKEYKVDDIIIAMPSISGEQIRELTNFLRAKVGTKVALRTLPALSEVIGGRVGIQHIRKVDVRDLLRREPIEFDDQPVQRQLKDQTILVSGAGGSIGSEICRQVSSYNPDKLILIDISEASLYSVHEELMTLFPQAKLIPIVGDICERQFMNAVFDQHHPRFIFHAAAYKHVTLMEQNPWSAVMNNIIGTQVLAAVSAEHGVERFVLISTDKAIRPTSIMGATKRICEIILQVQQHRDNAIYCAVRFGNVMGSSGSVIPKFERQIHNGGPVTVTDKETTRFFMLTSEAVHLVLHAAAFEQDKATYTLDMGKPVKIIDLARDMIQLYGDDSPRPIEIVLTGLKPGEKLHEELLDLANLRKTANDKIWINIPTPVDADDFLTRLDELTNNCLNLPRKQLYKTIGDLVPDFKPFNYT